MQLNSSKTPSDEGSGPSLVLAIPTYNRVASLCALLDSITAELQAHASTVRVVVLDNCSVDATEAEMKVRAARFAWLKYTRHGANRGGVANIRSALEGVAGSDYVWLLSDHTLLEPGAVGRLLAHLRTHRPDAVCAGICNYATLVSSTEDLHIPATLPAASQAALYFHFSNVSSVVASAALVHASEATIEQCGRFSYPHLGLWKHLAPDRRLGFVPRLSRFSSTAKGPGYAWFASGVLDYGETIGLNHSPDLAREILVATGRMKFFYNTILRHLAAVRSRRFSEVIDAEMLRRAWHLFQFSPFQRTAQALIMKMPTFSALFLSHYLSGPRGLRSLPQAWRQAQAYRKNMSTTSANPPLLTKFH